MKREDIEKSFSRIGELADRQGIIVDLAVYGGSAMALRWEFRRSTRDVDVIISGDKSFMRKAVSMVGEEMGLPDNWMNDAVKGFSSSNADHEFYKEYLGESGGIRVFVPKAEYLLAMKCMAMRLDSPDGHNDADDIKSLVAVVGVKSKKDLCDTVERYYPRDKIPSKVYFGIEQIMIEVNLENRRKRKKSPPENSL
ncbi:MAG: DUF6036 family nucleotidyltransferase [Acidithiobacillus sp.]